MAQYNYSKSEAKRLGVARVRIDGGGSSSSSSKSSGTDYAAKLLQQGFDPDKALGSGKFGSSINSSEYKKIIGGSDYRKITASEQLQPYLDNFQNIIKQGREALNSPILQQGVYEEIKTALTPSSPRPEAPNFMALFQELRSDGEIQVLETGLNDLKAQEEEALAKLRQTKTGERGKFASTSVIANRIGKAEQQAMEEIEFIGRQKQRIGDELTSRYNLINTMIDLTGRDYDIAYREYNDEFSRNLTVYQTFRQRVEREEDKITRTVERAEDRVFDIAKTRIEWERADDARREDAARSNLQIYTNLITSGNLSYKDMSSSTKAEIAKLEVRSGLGVGFLSKVRNLNENGEIKSITTREDANGVKYSDVVIQKPDGSLKVESMKLGSTSGGAEGTTAALLTKYKQAMEVETNPKTGYMDANVFKDLVKEYGQRTGKDISYLGKFYIDPKDPLYEDVVAKAGSGRSAD